MTPSEALTKYFGYTQFRLNQASIIDTVLSGKDCFAIMPTGGGKSLCYQIPSMVMPGLGLVISPLIALMKDQVDALKAAGISAESLNSTQSSDEQEWILHRLKRGEIKVLYLSPERLLGGQTFWLSFLKVLPINLVAIDEAHCISQWGHDFRPEYLSLGQLKDHFPRTPILALTASADPSTQTDIVEKLRLDQPQVFISSFDRPNITYRVWPKQNGIRQILEFVRGHRGQSGIIYCLSRKSTEKLAETLRAEGWPAAAYHAAMSTEERTRVQEGFQKDEIMIIVATIAFGMGIDKSNVRYVIHYDTPKNMEGYYQETGRAGRDGLASEALLLYSYGDIIKLENFILSDDPSLAEIQKEKLQQMKAFAERPGCRRKKILAAFGEPYPDICHQCDFCLQGNQTQDGTEDAQRLLSAVARCGQYYGAGFIIDFLRGSQSVKISPSLKSTKTWGAGKHHPASTWKYLIDQLVELGYLSVHRKPYPVLVLNEKSWELLKGGGRLNLYYPEKKEKTGLSHDALAEDIDTLFQVLRETRSRIAKACNLPPYIVVTDLCLQEMATQKPKSPQELLSIPGIGEYKASQYGPYFLEAIRHRTPPIIDLNYKSPHPPAKPKGSTAGTSIGITLNMLEEGLGMEDVARLRNLSLSTVESHVLSLLAEGKVSIQSFLDPDRIQIIREKIKQTGITYAAKPIKDLLPAEYSYFDIRMVQTLHQKETTA